MSDNEEDRWWNDPDKANKPMPNSLIGISILSDDMQPVLVERVIYTQFRVVTVTDNLAANPEYQADTEEFPHLLEELEDELETFVVEVETGDYCKASEFFFMNNVKQFTAEVLPNE